MSTNMAAPAKTHIFKLEMSCEGCSKQISNVLDRNKDQGITNFEINFKEGQVTITGTLPVEKLTEILEKSGKKVVYVGEQN